MATSSVRPRGSGQQAEGGAGPGGAAPTSLPADLDRDHVACLVEAAAVLEASLELDQVVADLAAFCVPRLADVCTVHLLVDRSMRQVAEAHGDTAARLRLHGLRERREMAVGQVVSEVRDTHVVGAEDDRWAHRDGPLAGLRDVGVRSAVLAPLTAGGAVEGLLVLGFGEDRPAPRLADARLADQLAQRAGTVVGNARRYAELGLARRRAETALQVLQQTLVPAVLPSIPGVEVAARYHSAGDGTAPGGDFYDVFNLRSEAWGIVLGDVCGKGVEAAVLTALTRYTVRGAAIGERSPSRVLSRVNDVVLSDEAADRFCTVAYGRLRLLPGGARITLALSGHPPPLLVRREGSISRVGAPGLPVGVFEHIDPREEVVFLDEGDALVLYSDGVTEARSSGGWYGDDGLTATVAAAGPSADAIADAVASEVLSFSGGTLRDDMAVLVLRVT